LVWEFRTGARRADAVLLNGSSVAFEIKSDRDSLSRVTEQLQAFLQVFETTNLVVGERHVDAALGRAPREVGVLTLTDHLRFRTIRKAVPDLGRICSLAVLDSVSLSEAESMLARLGVTPPSVPNTERYAALRDIFAHQSSRLVHAAMVDTLKVTRSALPYADLLKRMPPVLYALVLAVRPPQRHWGRLCESMNLELHEIMR